MKKTIIIILALSLGFSCSRNRPKTHFDILTQNDWKRTEYKIEPGFYNGEGILTTDLLSIIPECREDDIYTFSTNNSFYRTGCNSTFSEFETKQWVLNKDETKIVFTNYNNSIDTFNIIEINNNILKLEETQYEGVIFRMTFKTK